MENIKTLQVSVLSDRWVRKLGLIHNRLRLTQQWLTIVQWLYLCIGSLRNHILLLTDPRFTLAKISLEEWLVVGSLILERR